jgi:plasmid stabilization system protein ParE
MSRRAVRQPRARRDIIEQALYIGRTTGAVGRVERSATRRPCGAGPVVGFRRAAHPTYELIFYRPIKDGIEVIRVLHASRDLAAVLDEDSAE